MRVRPVFTVLAAVGLIGVACDDDATGIPAGLEVFSATLNGANERPDPVTTTATGTALVTVMNNLVSWKVEVTGITNVSLGHIHFGAADEAGGVMVNLSPTTGSFADPTTIALGSLVVHDTVLTHMRAGNTYVNIHTSDNVAGQDPPGPAGDYPAGEIRGQLRKQ